MSRLEVTWTGFQEGGIETSNWWWPCWAPWKIKLQVALGRISRTLTALFIQNILTLDTDLKPAGDVQFYLQSGVIVQAKLFRSGRLYLHLYMQVFLPHTRSILPEQIHLIAGKTVRMYVASPSSKFKNVIGPDCVAMDLRLTLLNNTAVRLW